MRLAVSRRTQARWHDSSWMPMDANGGFAGGTHEETELEGDVFSERVVGE